MKPKTRTGVVHNAPGLYWLNVSTDAPPTHGYLMTRAGLRVLQKQIENVLLGWGGGGWAWAVKGGKVALIHKKFRRTRDEPVTVLYNVLSKHISKYSPREQARRWTALEKYVNKVKRAKDA